ncbi:MAG: succinate dehydrogenase cytochrome b subunit [Flavobacteriales bacterium]|nr:MAG: succinate dehydrogenase cytochrome b subunit [Bacteroidota bacterium]KXK34988.1 MAG: Succinate dehydrogenase cytochrome b-556 subunit [Chlorobi bacterium OLB6]MBE2265165.1 succinate dehydrogenase cytochrome b subunit [Flavobacteriales bacterium]MBV6463716.1 hypothetical protein [Chlorobiota bacterium]MBW7854487.1 succinate dehydrogenase cytochrome b subunit [Candidatus Kapabacteria bacterium]MCC6331764.1 succinate dehydrogenase cytochrome b subunit [Ignavibacteria bacterium]
MRTFTQVWNSTIIQKWVMAISGLGIVGFLIAHLSGNLLVFLGPEHMNSYAVELRGLLHGSALWVARIGLIVMLVLHVITGIKLTRLNKGARTVRNERVTPRASTVAGRSMAYTGLLILVYILYHLAHFTWGMAQPEAFNHVDAAGRHDVYRMIVEGFSQPLIVVIYAIAMVVTGMHLNHAIQSAFQTLGINHPKYTPLIRTIGPLLGLLIVVGFLSVPLAVITGLVK